MVPVALPNSPTLMLIAVPARVNVPGIVPPKAVAVDEKLPSDRSQPADAVDTSASSREVKQSRSMGEACA
eukprot:6309148-Prymnesium_polylepis.2